MQLLELENAFEGNQYVVGAERKALAKRLNLTETQVNTSFQIESLSPKYTRAENKEFLEFVLLFLGNSLSNYRLKLSSASAMLHAQ